MKENIAQKEWKLAEEAYKNKDHVSQLYHLYNMLKNTPIDDEEGIRKINSMRELVFDSLKMKELELFNK